MILLYIVTFSLLTAFNYFCSSHECLLHQRKYLGLLLMNTHPLKTRVTLASDWPNCEILLLRANQIIAPVQHQRWSDDSVFHLNIVLNHIDYPEVVLCRWRAGKLAFKVTVTHHTPSHTLTHTHPSFLSLFEGNSPHRCNQTYCFDLLWALQLLRA